MSKRSAIRLLLAIALSLAVCTASTLWPQAQVMACSDPPCKPK